MRVLLLFRGSPGCGKSTFIEENGLKPYTLSADDIRLMYSAPVLLTNGKYSIEQKNDNKVWKTLFNILENRMQQGEFTVIDATNSKTSEMRRYKELADTYRYRIFCIDMTDVPIEVAKKRNKGRNVEEVNSEEENSEEVTESTPDYSTMTLKELKEVADDKGISYSNRVSKASLINKIEEEN